MSDGLMAHTRYEDRDLTAPKEFFAGMAEIKTDPEIVQLATTDGWKNLRGIVATTVRSDANPAVSQCFRTVAGDWSWCRPAPFALGACVRRLTISAYDDR